MIHLSWNLARNIRVQHRKFFELIRFTVGQSLRYVHSVVVYLEDRFGPQLELRKQLRTDDEPAHYCITCDCEVFNYLFVSEMDRKHVVRCLDCALDNDPAFDNVVVLYQFTLDDLERVYEQFQFNALPSARTLIDT